jgi:hypothetical protein
VLERYQGRQNAQKSTGRFAERVMIFLEANAWIEGLGLPNPTLDKWLRLGNTCQLKNAGDIA